MAERIERTVRVRDHMIDCGTLFCVRCDYSAEEIYDDLALTCNPAVVGVRHFMARRRMKEFHKFLSSKRRRSILIADDD